MIDLNNYSDEKIEGIINDRINVLEANANKIKEIGNVERPNANASHHKGYISKDTKVCYSYSLGYYMRTTDYIHEFVEYVRKNNLSPSPDVIFEFINNYFGKAPNTDNRNERTFKDISDFKHKGEALCTERAALSNNILSFLGMETWFCDGAIHRLNGQSGDHAFIIVKSESGKYRIYDPTYTICYNNEEHPFTKVISEKEAENILNSTPQNPSEKNLVKAQEYFATTVDGKTRKKDVSSYRMYGVGVGIEDLIEIENSFVAR